MACSDAVDNDSVAALGFVDCHVFMSKWFGIAWHVDAVDNDSVAALGFIDCHVCMSKSADFELFFHASDTT